MLEKDPRMNLHFRPHHFLCTLCFQGKGYSADFIHNFQTIYNLLHAKDGDSTFIEVRAKADDICTPCPHRIKQGCQTQTVITKLDKAHLKILGLESGQMLTWGEAKKRIREKINMEIFHAICSPCSWKKLGLCETALMQFLEKESP